MKKLIVKIICLTLLFLGLVFTINHLFKVKDKTWTTYKKDKGDIKSYPSTDTELARIRHKSDKVRKPASRPEEKTLFKRRLVKDENDYNLEDHNFEVINEINPDWQKRLSEDLLKFQEADTKVLVNPIESIFLLRRFKGRYVEKVIIKLNISSINKHIKILTRIWLKCEILTNYTIRI